MVNISSWHVLAWLSHGVFATLRRFDYSDTSPCGGADLGANPWLLYRNDLRTREGIQQGHGKTSLFFVYRFFVAETGLVFF